VIGSDRTDPTFSCCPFITGLPAHFCFLELGPRSLNHIQSSQPCCGLGWRMGRLVGSIGQLQPPNSAIYISLQFSFCCLLQSFFEESFVVAKLRFNCLRPASSKRRLLQTAAT